MSYPIPLRPLKRPLKRRATLSLAALTRWGLAAGGLALAGTVLPAWSQGQNYQADALKVTDFVGTLIVTTGGSGGMTADISCVDCPAGRLEDVEIRTRGDTLHIDGEELRKGDGPWWKVWDGVSLDLDDLDEYPVVTVRLPQGSAVTVDMMGRAEIGDTMGPLKLAGVAMTADVGRVKNAKLSIAGSGKFVVDAVEEDLTVSVAGSGDSEIGRAGSASVSIAGSGNVRLGTVDGPLSVSVAGSGDVRSDSAQGSVSVKIAGSGDVAVKNGRADPLTVRVNGSGDFDFGGVAVNPTISVNGSGNVRLAAMEGSLDSRGSGTIKIGK